METKITYSTPRIESIIIDSEISLALESSPPMGPDETIAFNKPENFYQSPFQNSKV
jgi:hypothetical protein